MIIKMEINHSQKDLEAIYQYLTAKGLKIKDASSDDLVVFRIIGDTKQLDANQLELFSGVNKVIKLSSDYKLASKAKKMEPTVITLKNGVRIGDGNFVVMAGPCSVEDEAQIDTIASLVASANVKILRGGVFKPRTSPYAFSGLGLEGLKMLRRVADRHNLAIVTELMNEKYLDEFVKYVDIIQIGARNMQNYDLLRAVGKTNKPVLLKRGVSATIEEWLLSCEYILAGGNPNVILCERGIRTFEKYTRNTLDISAVLAVKNLSHLPVIVDPSHASGRYEMVSDLAAAALAVGADGLMVEVHPHPELALSDGAQSLKPKRFLEMMEKLNKISVAFDKKIK